MPRELSPAIISSLFAQETDGVYLLLLEIETEQGNIYATSDTVPTEYDGKTYQPVPFEITLPEMSEGKMSSARIALDNVGLDLIEEVRLQTAPMRVDIIVILAETQEIMLQVRRFLMHKADFTDTAIQGELTRANFLDEAFPSRTMDHDGYPGLF